MPRKTKFKNLFLISAVTVISIFLFPASASAKVLKSISPYKGNFYTVSYSETITGPKSHPVFLGRIDSRGKVTQISEPLNLPFVTDAVYDRISGLFAILTSDQTGNCSVWRIDYRDPNNSLNWWFDVAKPADSIDVCTSIVIDHWGWPRISGFDSRSKTKKSYIGSYNRDGVLENSWEFSGFEFSAGSHLWSSYTTYFIDSNGFTPVNDTKDKFIPGNNLNIQSFAFDLQWGRWVLGTDSQSKQSRIGVGIGSESTIWSKPLKSNSTKKNWVTKALIYLPDLNECRLFEVECN